MAEVTANITGIEDILKALKELPAKMERSVIVAALKDAGKPIRDEARSNVRSVSGDLAKSIRTVTVAKKYSAGGGPRVRITSGSKAVFYAHIIEGGAKPHRIPEAKIGSRKNRRDNPAMAFGGKVVKSVNHPGIKAQRFMKRAFDSKGAEAIKRFGESLGPKLEASLASFFQEAEIMESGIYARLIAHSGTAALVGTRVYKVDAGQNPTYPYVVMSRTDTSPVSSLIEDTTLNSAFLSVDCFGSTFASVKAVVAQVILALKRYHGTSASIVIEDAFLRGESHSYDPDLDIYQISLSFEVFYRS